MGFMPVHTPLAVGDFSPEGDFDCVALQDRLDNYFAMALMPKNRQRRPRFLEMLTSEANRRPQARQLAERAMDGSVRRIVRLQFRRPACLEICKADISCDAPRQPKQVSPLEVEYTLPTDPFTLCDGQGAALDLVWDYGQYRELCINQPNFFEETLAEALQDIDRKVNDALLADLMAKLGCFPNTGGTIYEREMPLFLDNTTTAVKTPNPHVFFELDQDQDDANYDGRYAVLGGRDMREFITINRATTGGVVGVDNTLLESENVDFVYDKGFNLTYGQDAFVSIPYGALQLVNYADNVADGYYALDTPNEKRMVVRTPAGLAVDMYWERNIKGPKCNEIRVNFSLYVELAAVPGGGCELEHCVNGIFKYRNCATPAAPQCVTLDAAFAWECFTGPTQYDATSFTYPAYTGIIINATTYNFSQTFNVSVQAEFDAMIAEINAILQGIDTSYQVVWADYGSQALTLWAGASLGIALTTGLDTDNLSENPADDFLKVTNTSAGTYDFVVWNVDGTAYAGAPDAFIDPTGDVIGTFDTFYLSGPIVGNISPVTLTVNGGGLSANTSGDIGPCV